MKPRIVLQSIAAAVAVMAAGVASASPVYPDFTVNTSALGGGGSLVPFTANDISGQYHEQLTFTSATTFTVALNFTAQGFNYDDTNPALTTSLTAAQTGLGSNYGLLALFNGTGTYSTSGGVTTFTLNPGGGVIAALVVRSCGLNVSPARIVRTSRLSASCSSLEANSVGRASLLIFL